MRLRAVLLIDDAATAENCIGRRLQIHASPPLVAWMDARHRMNELADLVGAALIVAAPEDQGFIVIASEDLGDAERAAHGREILDSRCSG